jgi:hypothetical protein
MNSGTDRRPCSWLRRALVGTVFVGVVMGRAPSLGARDDASATLVTAGPIDVSPRYHDEHRMSHLEGEKLLVTVLFLLQNKSSSR